MNLQYIVNLGAFFFRKARANQAESGTYQAARNLRKQGVPLSIALDVLARKSVRYTVLDPAASYPTISITGKTFYRDEMDFTARA